MSAIISDCGLYRYRLERHALSGAGAVAANGGCTAGTYTYAQTLLFEDVAVASNDDDQVIEG